jgi:hypothetical protein
VGQTAGYSKRFACIGGHHRILSDFPAVFDHASPLIGLLDPQPVLQAGPEFPGLQLQLAEIWAG